MIPSARLTSRLRPSAGFSLRCLTKSVSSQGGRTAPTRQIQTITNHDRKRYQNFSVHPATAIQQQLFFNLTLRKSLSTSSTLQAISFRDLKSDDKSEKQAKREPIKEGPKTDPAEEAYQRATRENQARKAKVDAEKAQAKKEEQKKEESDEGQADEGENQEKKREPPPPPPPHGTKTPWQVFTETLKTEFKASKEWNESTKQLASSAHQFTENESVKRARAAYSAASGAATSGTASALKNTGKALGQGAAWTWDSTVVKGIRTGANAAGKGIDKATQPIRETKAFKSVKDVVDDGSSSRYGGWLEKEERRKRREQREMEEASASGRPGRRVEKMEEDPEYVVAHYSVCDSANGPTVPART